MREEIVKKAKELSNTEGALNNRRRCIVFLAPGVRELLVKLIEEEGLVTETGGKYPIS